MNAKSFGFWLSVFIIGDVVGTFVTYTFRDKYPSILERSRDAQIDAAYDAGFSAASDYYRNPDKERALRECTERLMTYRRPGGTP